MRPDLVLGDHGVVQAYQSFLRGRLGGNRVGLGACGGGVAYAQSRGGARADLDVVVVLRRVVGRAEVDLQLAGGRHAAADVRAA